MVISLSKKTQFQIHYYSENVKPVTPAAEAQKLDPKITKEVRSNEQQSLPLSGLEGEKVKAKIPEPKVFAEGLKQSVNNLRNGVSNLGEMVSAKAVDAKKYLMEKAPIVAQVLGQKMAKMIENNKVLQALKVKVVDFANKLTNEGKIAELKNKIALFVDNLVNDQGTEIYKYQAKVEPRVPRAEAKKAPENQSQQEAISAKDIPAKLEANNKMIGMIQALGKNRPLSKTELEMLQKLTQENIELQKGSSENKTKDSTNRSSKDRLKAGSETPKHESFKLTRNKPDQPNSSESRESLNSADSIFRASDEFRNASNGMSSRITEIQNFTEKDLATVDLSEIVPGATQTLESKKDALLRSESSVNMFIKRKFVGKFGVMMDRFNSQSNTLRDRAKTLLEKSPVEVNRTAGGLVHLSFVENMKGFAQKAGEQEKGGSGTAYLQNVFNASTDSTNLYRQESAKFAMTEALQNGVENGKIQLPNGTDAKSLVANPQQLFEFIKKPEIQQAVNGELKEIMTGEKSSQNTTNTNQQKQYQENGANRSNNEKKENSSNQNDVTAISNLMIAAGEADKNTQNRLASTLTSEQLTKMKFGDLVPTAEPSNDLDKIKLLTRAVNAEKLFKDKSIGDGFKTMMADFSKTRYIDNMADRVRYTLMSNFELGDSQQIHNGLGILSFTENLKSIAESAKTIKGSDTTPLLQTFFKTAQNGGNNIAKDVAKFALQRAIESGIKSGSIQLEKGLTAEMIVRTDGQLEKFLAGNPPQVNALLDKKLQNILTGEGQQDQSSENSQNTSQTKPSYQADNAPTQSLNQARTATDKKSRTSENRQARTSNETSGRVATTSEKPIQQKDGTADQSPDPEVKFQQMIQQLQSRLTNLRTGDKFTAEFLGDTKRTAFQVLPNGRFQNLSGGSDADSDSLLQLAKDKKMSPVIINAV